MKSARPKAQIEILRGAAKVQVPAMVRPHVEGVRELKNVRAGRHDRVLKADKCN